MLITGNIIDSVNKEGLTGANCKIIRGTSVDSKWDGKTGFATKGEPNAGIINTDQPLTVGTYQFFFSFIGYKQKIKVFQILSTTTVVELGNIELVEEIYELETAEVIAFPTYQIIGKVVNVNQEPIGGALIKDDVKTVISNQGKNLLEGPNSTTSEPSGDFTLEGAYDVINQTTLVNEEYTVVKGDTLYIIARKFPIEGETESQRVEAIYQANLTLMENRSTTNSEGNLLENQNLIFPGDVLIVPSITSSPSPSFTLNISATGYGPSTITPFDQDGTIQPSIGVIVLQSTQADLNDSISDEIPLPATTVKSMKLTKVNFEMAQQKAINQLITTVKTVLLPAVLTQLASFGISKASEAVKKNFGDINVTCPANLEELNRLIERKNKLVKAINNIYRFLDKIRIGVKILDGVLTAAQIALGVGKALTFIPITPVSPLATSTANVVEKVEREIKKYKLISTTTLTALTILVELLRRLFEYLSLLDQAIGKCAIEGALPQEQLSSDLLASTKEQSQQLSPVVTNINGFEMGVIPIDNVTVGGVKRRKAIARNKAGVIMLEGEPSFSSNDQILIDELVFYIQQNDLKAD